MKTQTTDNNRQNSTWFRVTGECMAPLIRKDDLVLSIPINAIDIGDIVVIAGPLPLVHRVVKINNSDYLLTKGDNSLSLDLPITRGNLAGKVVAIVKKDSKPIFIEGRLWGIKNYLMAKYSLVCYTLWKLLRNNKYFICIYRRFSAPLKNIYIFLANTITRFATSKSR